MKTRSVVILIVVLVLLGGAFLFGAAAAFLSHLSGGSNRGLWSSGNEIGVVTVEGGIYNDKDILENIDDFRRDDAIKAIILRIDSPGGSVATSQEIYQALVKAREVKPVIASMATLGASGGYYVALGASKILANPGTVTGSIGVRLDHVMLKDLFTWAKIQHETLKSGKFKDIGTFDRPLTDEERALLQNLMDDIHAQFKETVARERKLDPAEVDRIADGRVYTGREAFELKLIDALGGFTDAVALAKELSGITGEPELVEHKKSNYEWLGAFVESTMRMAAEALVGAIETRSARMPEYRTR